MNQHIDHNILRDKGRVYAKPMKFLWQSMWKPGLPAKRAHHAPSCKKGMAGIWYFRDEHLAFCAAQRHIAAARHCDLYPTPLPFLGVSSL